MTCKFVLGKDKIQTGELRLQLANVQNQYRFKNKKLVIKQNFPLN